MLWPVFLEVTFLAAPTIFSARELSPLSKENTNNLTGTKKISQLFDRCLEPSHPQRIILRLKTNFSLSPPTKDYIKAENKLQSISWLFIPQVCVFFVCVCVVVVFLFFFPQTTTQIISTILEEEKKERKQERIKTPRIRYGSFMQ